MRIIGSTRWLGLLPALALALGACERVVTTAVQPEPSIPIPMVRAATVPLDSGKAMGVFQVCSVGSAATYTFTAQNYPDVTPGGSGAKTGSKTLAADECGVVYTTNVHGLSTVNAVTITMTNPTTPDMQYAGGVGHQLFWHCEHFPCVVDDTPTPFAGTSVTYNVNGDIGALAYFNFTPLAPSLTLTKAADATSVTAGTPVGFTMTVNSTGPGTAHAVTLTDSLPAALTWSESPDNALCSIAGRVLTCNFGDLAAGASASVHVTAPTTGVCGALSNTARVEATGVAPVEASASTTVDCPPSLSLTKVADAAKVSAGDTIGFTLVLTNTGLGTATNVTVNDALPTGTGLNWSLKPAVAGCSISAGVLSCSFATLAVGASVTIHVASPTVFQSCAAYSNTATAAADAVLPVQASATTTVQCPSLSLTKTADAASVSAGSNIGFTMTVTNAGPGAAKNVTLSDPLPTGTGIVWAISPANAACSIVAGTLSCNFGTLASGASASVHVTSPTTSGSCGTYDNTATLTATGVDALQASAITEVLCSSTSCGTLTIGYWKTHAGFGPQADVVTRLLPIWLGTAGGTKSVKVITASQAVTLLQMNGKPSNPVNKLYAQLLGAKLNIASGVDGSAVAALIATADAFLATHDQNSSLTKAEQATVTGWASTLDKYNNGIIGPGHCDG